MTQKRAYVIRPRDESLKKKWEGVADHVSVNLIQYSFDSVQREEEYLRAQFPTQEEWNQYQHYREEWYRRAKEFDPGEAPLAVTCELVSICNLACSMCYTPTEEFQSSVVGAQRMLPYETVCQIIDECVHLGVSSMLFSWRGESALYKSRYRGTIKTLPDVLAYARKKGILEITCLTNGQMIDERMAKALVEAEPSWISFSIDGLEEAYNKIRTPPKHKKGDRQYNAFQAVIENIKRLINAREKLNKTRPQLRTNTIFPAIASNPQMYHDYMESIGIGWITINGVLDFRGKNLPDDDIIENWACQYPFQRLTVAANGLILPCTGAHNEEHELILGRYFGSQIKRVRHSDGTWKILEYPERSLYDAWHSSELAEIRKLHQELKRTEIMGCRNCRHGAVKHDVQWIPADWDVKEMVWKGHIWRT